MPRNAFLSPNTFIASPSDGSACVSGCTPEGEFFAFFAFYFEDGGCAAFEARVHLLHGVRRILRRGPSLAVRHDDIVQLLDSRRRSLQAAGINFLQVSPLAAKEVVDATVEACGQTLLDQEPWGVSWHALNSCIFTLQFRHEDMIPELSKLNLLAGTSAPLARLPTPSPTQPPSTYLRASSAAPSSKSQRLVPLVGSAGAPGRAKLRGSQIQGFAYRFRDETRRITSPALDDLAPAVPRFGHADVPIESIALVSSTRFQPHLSKTSDGWRVLHVTSERPWRDPSRDTSRSFSPEPQRSAALQSEASRLPPRPSTSMSLSSPNPLSPFKFDGPALPRGPEGPLCATRFVDPHRLVTRSPPRHVPAHVNAEKDSLQAYRQFKVGGGKFEGGGRNERGTGRGSVSFSGEWGPESEGAYPMEGSIWGGGEGGGAPTIQYERLRVNSMMGQDSFGFGGRGGFSFEVGGRGRGVTEEEAEEAREVGRSVAMRGLVLGKMNPKVHAGGAGTGWLWGGDLVVSERGLKHLSWWYTAAGDEGLGRQYWRVGEGMTTGAAEALRRAVEEGVEEGAGQMGREWVWRLRECAASRLLDWTCRDMMQVRLPANMSGGNGKLNYHAVISSSFNYAYTPIPRC